MPFGFINATPALQRVINQFSKRHDLKYVNVYLNNIYVGKIDQQSLDENIKALRSRA